jgi:hypothetical protein
MENSHAQTRKELYHIAGDMPDPRGTGLRGAASTMDLTATAMGHPKIFYRNGSEQFVIEADVYKLPNEPAYVHLICPYCRNALRIVQGEKHIEYDPDGFVPLPRGWDWREIRQAFPTGLGGLISIEQFKCVWESEPSLRREYGLSRCGWRCAVENNVAMPS